MSGVRSSRRTPSDALFSRLSKAAAVRTGSLMAGSLTVSKKRSMLDEATVNVVAPGRGPGVAVAFPLTPMGAAGSGKMV